MITAKSLPRYISIALYALLFLGGASAAQAGRIYEKTYRSIVESIYSAQGQAYIDITEGRWQTDRRGTTLTWLIERPTTLKTKFNYASGNLLSASAEFDQPIVIEMRSGKYCLRYKIKRIFYGEAGRLISPETRGPNPDWAVDANCRDVSRLTRQIDQHLEFSSDVQSLFYGRPFASSSSSRLEGRNTLVPMVTRVQLLSDGHKSGSRLRSESRT